MYFDDEKKFWLFGEESRSSPKLVKFQETDLLLSTFLFTGLAKGLIDAERHCLVTHGAVDADFYGWILFAPVKFHEVGRRIADCSSVLKLHFGCCRVNHDGVFVRFVLGE